MQPPASPGQPTPRLLARAGAASASLPSDSLPTTTLGGLVVAWAAEHRAALLGASYDLTPLPVAVTQTQTVVTWTNGADLPFVAVQLPVQQANKVSIRVLTAKGEEARRYTAGLVGAAVFGCGFAAPLVVLPRETLEIVEDFSPSASPGAELGQCVGYHCSLSTVHAIEREFGAPWAEAVRLAAAGDASLPLTSDCDARWIYGTADGPAIYQIGDWLLTPAPTSRPLGLLPVKVRVRQGDPLRLQLASGTAASLTIQGVR